MRNIFYALILCSILGFGIGAIALEHSKKISKFKVLETNSQGFINLNIDRVDGSHEGQILTLLDDQFSELTKYGTPKADLKQNTGFELWQYRGVQGVYLDDPLSTSLTGFDIDNLRFNLTLLKDSTFNEDDLASSIEVLMDGQILAQGFVYTKQELQITYDGYVNGNYKVTRAKILSSSLDGHQRSMDLELEVSKLTPEADDKRKDSTLTYKQVITEIQKFKVRIDLNRFELTSRVKILEESELKGSDLIEGDDGEDSL